MTVNKDQNRIDAIAKRIKALRVEAGYTSYEKFAIENGIARKQYWRLEKGHNFKITSLFRILDIHGITLEEFGKGLKI